jgi:hypothetical protein
MLLHLNISIIFSQEEYSVHCVCVYMNVFNTDNLYHLFCNVCKKKKKLVM